MFMGSPQNLPRSVDLVAPSCFLFPEFCALDVGRYSPAIFSKLQKRLVRELRVDTVANYHGVKRLEQHRNTLGVGGLGEAQVARTGRKHIEGSATCVSQTTLRSNVQRTSPMRLGAG